MAYPPLEDNTPIPFGKHRGVRMIELPIDYLMWALEKAEIGSPVNVYAKKNETWIRQEGKTGKHNRPVKVSGVDRNPPEEAQKPTPPNLMTASDFIRKELNTDAENGDELPVVFTISSLARLAERYKNYFNGSPNLKPLPRKEKPKETMVGWGEDQSLSAGYVDSETVNSNDVPF